MNNKNTPIYLLILVAMMHLLVGSRNGPSAPSISGPSIAAQDAFKNEDNDISPLVLSSCPSNQMFCDNGTNTFTFTPPTATSDCSGAVPVTCVRSDGLGLGAAYPLGTTGIGCSAEDSCGNRSSCGFTVTVRQNPSCEIVPPEVNPVCGTTGNPLTANVSGGTPPYDLTWSVAGIGWSIDDPKANPISYNSGCASGSATVTLSVIDAVGCQHQCSLDIACSPRLISATSLIRPSDGSGIAASGDFLRSSTCEEVPDLCTLGQGTYGNKNGRFNREAMEEIVARLITAARPLVIGVPERSITFMDGSEQCLIQALPAGSTSRTLPPDLGNLTVGNGCAIPSSLLKNGRFKNVLLGQTIALLLNTRLDETLHELYLGGLASCHIFGTQKALPGPDSLLGTSDDIPDPGPDLVPGTGDEPILTFTFPVSVINAMVALGLSQDVDGLLTLANRALGGDTNLGDTSLSDINDAVETINRAFDGCRIPIGARCSNLPAQRIYPNINSRLKDGLK